MGLWGNIGVFSDVMGYSGVGNGWIWNINLTLCRGLKKQYKSCLKAWRTCLDKAGSRMHTEFIDFRSSKQKILRATEFHQL
jgi:hypothetical protein